MKRSEKAQAAAIKSHQKGQEALDKGDLQAAFQHDDDSAVGGIEAMMLRMSGQ